jgi:hypothetical protein
MAGIYHLALSRRTERKLRFILSFSLQRKASEIDEDSAPSVFGSRVDVIAK